MLSISRNCIRNFCINPIRFIHSQPCLRNCPATDAIACTVFNSRLFSPFPFKIPLHGKIFVLDAGSQNIRGSIFEMGSDGKLKYFLNLGTKSVNLGGASKEHKGWLNKSIQEAALKSFIELCTTAKEHGVVGNFGIATAAYREAKNGSSFLDLLRRTFDLHLTIPSQKEEGALGFFTGLKIFHSRVPGAQIAFLDLGGSSVQITGIEIHESYGLNLGLSTLEQLFAEQIRGQTYSTNAEYSNITYDEILKLSDLTMKSMPQSDWISERIALDNIKFCFADWTSTLNVIEQLTSKRNNLSKEDVETCLKKLTNSSVTLERVTNEQRQYLLFCLTIIYSLMRKLGFKEINLGVNEAGNNPGLIALTERFLSRQFTLA